MDSQLGAGLEVSRGLDLGLAKTDLRSPADGHPDVNGLDVGDARHRRPRPLSDYVLDMLGCGPARCTLRSGSGVCSEQ